ncbi:MAG: hypothetical protein LBB60_08230 [Desulfovibrio sp.]|nr:hypothetical protein [Desulfovibrio sp.]
MAWESNCAESIKQAVICNHGLAMLSGRLVAKELASGEINFIPIVDCMWKRHYLLVHSKNKKLTEPMNIFITLARRYEQYGFSCPMSASDLLKSAGDFCLIE